ncbi:MAG: hypothetical protein KKG47_06545 [Proteobacteria bacterium]|nr:hypothetical protein [Pseudomonadota bacterium]MBU1739768.1 hypothetical protein [Pseudomonadota bacterium]
MKIYCNTCAKTIGEIADEKIPANKKVFIKCPHCATRIAIRKEQPELKLQMEETPSPPAEKPPAPAKSARNHHQKISGKDEVDPGRFTSKSYQGRTGTDSGLTIVAVGLLVILFIFIGLRFWSFANVYKLNQLGPSRISENRDSLIISAAGKIFHYRKSGGLHSVTTLSDLGITPPVADISLLEDNSVIIGERGSGRIRHCTLGTLTCEDISPTGEFAIKDAFRFLVNEKARVLYIADTLGGRLLSHGLNGRDTRILDTDVSFPNDMFIDDGRLYLCDTFNARVIKYKIDNNADLDRNASPLVSLESFTTPGGLKNLTQLNPEELKKLIAKQAEKMKDPGNSGVMIDRPISLAKDPSGRWWLGLTSETEMFGSEIRIFSGMGDPITKLTDPKGGNPEDFLLLNGEMLVADPVLMRVYRINPSIYTVSNFDGVELNNDLEGLRTRHAIASFFKQWSTRIMLLVGVCLLGLLFYIKSRQS